MGERKGQNFYYPPDFNYKEHKNLNNYHGTHALRERAKKIKEGILIIRFEMPFNVWCLGCNNHVGMGVRYNAEKKKIGMYYTTPLYEFRMKCHLCENYFIIRTDPKNFDYELVEGVKRQEKRFDPSSINNIGPIDRNDMQKLSSDAMAKKQSLLEDKYKSESSTNNIEHLINIQTRMSSDYSRNCILRNDFRAEKNKIKQDSINDDQIKKRLSTNINLKKEVEEDKIFARKLLKLKNNDFQNCQTKDNSSLILQTCKSCNCLRTKCICKNLFNIKKRDFNSSLNIKIQNSNKFINAKNNKKEQIKKNRNSLGVILLK